jgi:HTH-type transcriptional regulator/antitoxin HigA
MHHDTFEQIRNALGLVPFLTRIENAQDYKQALAMMDELIDSYDANRTLIDILAASIEAWEDSAPEFAEFNSAVSKLDGIDVLKTLMEQHGLGVNDLPELGSKSTVSKLLNRSEGRKLNRNHIEALSCRFGMSPAVFF